MLKNNRNPTLLLLVACVVLSAMHISYEHQVPDRCHQNNHSSSERYRVLLIDYTLVGAVRYIYPCAETQRETKRAPALVARIENSRNIASCKRGILYILFDLVMW